MQRAASGGQLPAPVTSPAALERLDLHTSPSLKLHVQPFTGARAWGR